jgi:hypothetical protein
MGYRNDGNFGTGGKDWEGVPDGTNSPISPNGKQNPAFLYPDKSIRFLEAEGALERGRGKPTTIADGSYKIHRGYIRNLEQKQFAGGLEFPISRCNFQFNPQQINQSVAMRDDIYLPLLQPPEQLAQPIGANTNFSFDLFFDRSHEMAKGSLGRSADLNNIQDIDPYDIGVMADLRVFYSVIGQGFSAEMINFQKKMFEYNAKSSWTSLNSNQPDSTSSTTDGATSDSETTPDTSVTPTTPSDPPDFSQIPDIANANIGNFALLMPNPVRVMFSSLFMIDGFITSTNVDFLKFNTNMVPLQCRIGVTMNAMYIGFAKPTTFLTDLFDKAAGTQFELDKIREAANQELAQAYSTIKTFAFGAVQTGGSEWDIDGERYKAWKKITQGERVDATGGTDDESYSIRLLPVYEAALSSDSDVLGVDEEYMKNIPTFAVGFRNIIPKPGAGVDADQVLILMKQDGNVTVSYSWSVDIYGPDPSATSLPGGIPLSLNDAKNLIKKGTYTQETYSYKKLGSYSGEATASSIEEWGSGEKEGTRQYLVETKNSSGSAIKLIDYDRTYDPYDPRQPRSLIDNGSWFRNSAFVVEYYASISISNPESDVLTREARYAVALPGESDLHETVNVGEFTTGGEYTGGPRAPIDNLDGA